MQQSKGWGRIEEEKDIGAKMTSVDGIIGWKNLKQRLSFKGLGCCGAAWASPGATTLAIAMAEEEREEEPIMQDQQVSDQQEQVAVMINDDMGQILEQRTHVTTSGMNLAMALAAERNLRVANVGPAGRNAGPVKTLMRLIEETDGVDLRKNSQMKEKDDQGNENDWMCCVCMERKKGAAFIPCGHAFCRVCSRELWVNRGTCPICNRLILEVLDIF